MDAHGAFWEGPASLGNPSLNENQATIASTQQFQSMDQVFLISLSFAIDEYAKQGLPAFDLTKTNALESLKSIARMMHSRKDEYADWLEAKVRRYASEHPHFILEIFPDELLSIFSPSSFVAEGKHISSQESKPPQESSASFVSRLAALVMQSTLAQGHYNSLPAEIQSQEEAVCLNSGQDFHPFGMCSLDYASPISPFASGNIPYMEQSYMDGGVVYVGLVPRLTTRDHCFATPPAILDAQGGVFSFQFNETSPPSPRIWGNQIVSGNEQPTAPRHLPSYFQPSRELVGQIHTPSQQRLIQAHRAGLVRNPEYRGDLTELDIANASCPPDQNCAIRIENISREATNAEIFDLISEGRVFSFSKKEPIPGRFPNCAARLVFTTRKAAEAFVARGQSWEGIVLHGHRFSVKWNRDVCRPIQDDKRHQSRIIQVVGPEKELNVEGVEMLFHTHIKFKPVRSREWLVEGGKKVVEISFCSILGQSRIACKFFHEYIDAWQLNGRFSVGFGPDPCEPVVESSAPML